jgi:membrane associated rhomboid family serine protease
MIWGVLPQQIGISWQSHLFGFIGGGLAAYWLTRSTRHERAQPNQSHLVIDMDDLE